MSEQVQTQVLQQLVKKMVDLGWEESAKESFGKEDKI